MCAINTSHLIAYGGLLGWSKFKFCLSFNAAGCQSGKSKFMGGSWHPGWSRLSIDVVGHSRVKEGKREPSKLMSFTSVDNASGLTGRSRFVVVWLQVGCCSCKSGCSVTSNLTWTGRSRLISGWSLATAGGLIGRWRLIRGSRSGGLFAVVPHTGWSKLMSILWCGQVRFKGLGSEQGTISFYIDDKITSKHAFIHARCLL